MSNTNEKPHQAPTNLNCIFQSPGKIEESYSKPKNEIVVTCFQEFENSRIKLTDNIFFTAPINQLEKKIKQAIKIILKSNVLISKELTTPIKQLQFYLDSIIHTVPIPCLLVELNTTYIFFPKIKPNKIKNTTKYLLITPISGFNESLYEENRDFILETCKMITLNSENYPLQNFKVNLKKFIKN